MGQRRLLWQLSAAYLAIIALALAASAAFSLRSFGRLYQQRAASELEETARLVGQRILAELSVEDRVAISALCKESGLAGFKRVSVILPSGMVAGDSDEDPAAMENHADRPEIRQAMAGGVGIATRTSRTLGREMMYVAVPLVQRGKTIAIVRTSMPTKAVASVLRSLDRRIIAEGCLIVLLAAGAALFLSRRVIKPLEEIRRGAHRFREGDLSYRLRVRGPAEVQSLAQTMNQMAAELEERMERQKRLEEMRREFVANVSHELKTPVTSIRGFAETLRDGAIGDPARAKAYLEIIAAHAGRLSAIIEDLLDLSRLEEIGEGERHIELRRAPLRSVVEAAVIIYSDVAAEKRIHILLACPGEITADISVPLLEQAVMNLLDNAIKYSGEGTEVHIDVDRADDNVCIAVRDQGKGIPQDHLPRIFERFYRVDTGRSRKQGGTGLGLAIVKHIVGLHGGRVTAKSEPERGSTFTIILPATQEC